MSTSTPPVPTQRKVKLVNALKATQSEQGSKLQNKFVLETDLLEDIRSYSKQRAAAENQYAQALHRITNQLLGKFQTKDENKEEDIRTPYGLWKKILEETEAMANARLKICQTLTSDVIESIKTLKAERAVTVKKCSALNDKLHEELLSSAGEMVKNQKNYSDLEKLTLQAHDATNEAQERKNKGTIGLFSSKGKLEKNLTRAIERRDVAEKRSTTARNDYLLHIAAMNAHQRKYYALDLPDLIAVQDGNIYENFKEYYNVITSAEKEVCEQGIKNIEALELDIKELQRAYAIQFFLKENPVFTKCEPYEMIPLPDDKVTTLSHEFEAGLALNKEARKWCMRIVQKQKMIRKKTKQLTKLKQTVSMDNNLNVEAPQAEKTEKGEKGEKPKTKEEIIEALTEEIRHLEVTRTKAEGRIEALKQAGIDTDEWLQGALNEQVEDNDDDDDEDIKSTGQQSRDFNSEDIDDDFEEEEWDEPSYSHSITGASDDALSITSSDVTKSGTPAVAIYTFEASAPEELNVSEHEEIDFLESHGDGWCKCRNKYGQVGYVPESYIDVCSRAQNTAFDGASTSPESSLAGSMTQDACQNEVTEPPAPEPEQEAYPDFICFAKAVYDYEACEDEELSFNEGDVIMVTSQVVDDDDGWWEGVLDGKKGVFPSIVVEETTPPPDQPIPRQRAQTDQFSSSNYGTVADAGRTYSTYS